LPDCIPEDRATVAALTERLRRLEWVAATQAQLAEADFDLPRFMQAVVDRVMQVSPATGVIIELAEGEAMVYRAVSDGLREHLGLRLARTGSLSGLCVARAETLYCRDAETDSRVDTEACRRIGLRSMVCVPLMRRGEAVGVLKALSPAPDAFSTEDAELLDLLAKALGTALAKQLAYDGLERERLARRAEAELFETAFHHAPIGYALVGLDGRFMKINDAFCGIVGYAPDALLAMTFHDITHPEDLDRDLSLLGELTAGRIPSYQMDKRYRRSDGALVWVNLSVSMVRERDGAPKHYIAQVQDLTQRMEVEARYRLMAENATDMIVITENGVTTFVSDACRKVVGRSPEECLRLRAEEYVHEEDLRVLVGAFSRAAAGEKGVRVRWRGRHQDTGQLVWLESAPSRLDSPDGRLLFVDVVRDVTDQVAHEAALAQARAEAEAAAAAKAEFLANMSHEIRTPLTAVIGFSGLLLQQPDLGCEGRRFAERISTAGQALLALVNDILDFSKLEAGEAEITPRPTDVAGMARDILGLFQIQAEAKGLALDLRVEPPPPAMVSVDPQALRQVLFNLVGNAVKFTDKGAVTLSLVYADERLEVGVADTGPGLTETQQAKLFQRFSQVDGSSTRKHGGTGLGLAICRALVEAMGGEIGVTSRPGEGARFHFTLDAPPCSLPGLDALGLGDVAGVSIDGVRVLVADDNPVNRDLVRAILEGLGAEVTEAEDGLAAVDAAAGLPFDVILMDLRMPRLDGHGALARIRAEDGPNQNVPILAFSASEAADIPPGFDGAASKPITVERLIGAIDAALQAPPPAPLETAGGRHVAQL